MDKLEEAAVNYINNLKWFGPRDPIAEGFIAGAYWQKSQDAQTIERLTKETAEAVDYVERLEANLAEAVRYLRIGKAQFAPNTTNSDVDTFLERQALNPCPDASEPEEENNGCKRWKT